MLPGWYTSEYNKHAGWPSNPNKTYKDDGFVSYPEMIGKEVKELLSFEKFQAEVRTAYESAGKPVNVARWYTSEYNKHAGWPARPEQKYKNDGFVGYAEMVGKK